MLCFDKKIILAGWIICLVFWGQMPAEHRSFAAGGPDETAVEREMEKIPSSSAAIDLILAASRVPSGWRGLNDAGTRSRRISINSDLFREDGQFVGQELVLQIFDTVKIASRIKKHFTNVNGTVSVTAHIDNSQWGRVFVVSTDGQVRAKVLWPERNEIYAIQYNPDDGFQYCLELDPDLVQFGGAFDCQTVYPPVDAAKSDDISRGVVNSETRADESEASVVADIMAVYSNDALAYAGSQANMENLLAIGMAMANDAHDNTDTGIVVNLVHSQQVNYNGTGDRAQDLYNITDTDDGIIDDVHGLRDERGADFVVLVVGDYESDGGIGWTLNDSRGGASYAFSVVTAPAIGSYTIAHEVGHNMGLEHAADQLYGTEGPTDWRYDEYGFGDIAAGWHWHPTPGKTGYCTVMTYSSGGYFSDGLDHMTVGLFSDPYTYSEGFPVGHAVVANNAHVLRSLKTIYEGYRDRSIGSNSILIDQPNGGEFLTAGQTYRIIWDSNGVTGNLGIELLKNGFLYRTIVSSTLNDRVYSWDLPADISGDDYTVRVRNQSGTISDVSDSEFTITEVFYSEPMDSNPGYSAQSGWEFGLPDNPTGFGGPVAANTGSYVYDTNLDGAVFSTTYLTSIPIDCGSYNQVRLAFAGQFSVYTGYEARIEISNDSSTWNQIYSQPGNQYSSDWTLYEFDISSYADGESTVYVRWGHIDNSGNENYCGMAVDDVELKGIEDKSIEVSTAAVNSVTKESARSGGTVVSYDGPPVTSRGVCWSTTNPPTTSNSTTTNGAGTGPFQSFLCGLSTGTTYYVRAYAETAAETFYGDVLSFATIPDTDYDYYVDPGGCPGKPAEDCFSSIASCFAALKGGDTAAIYVVRDVVFQGNVSLLVNANIIVRCGWDSTFTYDTGRSKIDGVMKLENGSVEISNATVQ